MVAEIGTAAQAGATNLDFDGGSWLMDPLRENVSVRNTIENTDGITGYLYNHAGRSREGRRLVTGQVIKNVSPYDMAFIAELLSGSTESTNNYDIRPVDTFYFNMLKYLTIDQDSGNDKDAIEYYDCKINRFVLRGQQARQGDQASLMLQGIIDIIGKGSAVGAAATAMDTAATYGTRTATKAQQPHLYTDSDNAGTSRILLNSVNITPLDFTLVWHNHLQPAWYNSQEILSLCPSRRTILLDMTLPWTTTTDGLHNFTLAAGTTGTLEFVNSDVSTKFDFTNVQWANEDPTIPGKAGGEVQFRIRARAFGASATTELVGDDIFVDDTAA